MTFGGRIALALVLLAAIAAGLTARAIALGLPPGAAIATALLLTIPLAVWTPGRLLGGLEGTMTALQEGLRAFRDSDFSMRLAPGGDERVDELTRTYNAIADVLRQQRSDVYQKELLLDTILQRTPMAVVLLDGRNRVLYSNAAARQILADGGRLDGQPFDAILKPLPEPIRDALGAGGDAIVSVPSADQDETFHVSQRAFRLNTIEHRLVLVERLTGELRRQEINVWKNAIRVINHELNNTIAPISSMIHSARIAQERPDRRHHLPEIYETIEERLAFLRTFLDSYAELARLPAPRKQRGSWERLLSDVGALYRFEVDGDALSESCFDPAQMQQVLINLVKNAHESGSDPAGIVVTIRPAVGGTLLRVADRGRGMTDEVLRQALVPFYTTRPGGSGLGLPLCNEILEAHGGRLRIQRRDGGGIVVSCFLPG